MQSQNNGGDVLARGGVKATFRPAQGVSQSKWDSIFGDFDADRYRRNADMQKTGDASPKSGKIEKVRVRI